MRHTNYAAIDTAKSVGVGGVCVSALSLMEIARPNCCQAGKPDLRLRQFQIFIYDFDIDAVGCNRQLQRPDDSLCDHSAVGSLPPVPMEVQSGEAKRAPFVGRTHAQATVCSSPSIGTRSRGTREPSGLANLRW